MNVHSTIPPTTKDLIFHSLYETAQRRDRNLWDFTEISVFNKEDGGRCPYHVMLRNEKETISLYLSGMKAYGNFDVETCGFVPIDKYKPHKI